MASPRKPAAKPARSAEFVARPNSKPGAAAKANAADIKSDRAIAKRYGVKTVR